MADAIYLSHLKAKPRVLQGKRNAQPLLQNYGKVGGAKFRQTKFRPLQPTHPPPTVLRTTGLVLIRKYLEIFILIQKAAACGKKYEKGTSGRFKITGSFLFGTIQKHSDW